MVDCERVLHVLHSMNCGGAENLIMNIYRSIDREKVQFDFLVNFYGDMYFQKEIEQLGGRIYRMKTLLQLTPWVYAAELEKFFKNHREYRIVHSHLETTTGIILECARKAGVPVRVAHAHNTRHTRDGLLFAAENTYKNYCRRKIKFNATAFFACSEAAARWLFREKSKETIILKNGIDTNKFRFSQEARLHAAKLLGIAKTTTVLVHTGRFYDQKNHVFLIDIFKAYQGMNPNSLLLLIGEGPLLSEIKKRAADLGVLDSVLFLGIRDDVCSILQRADAFVLPSKFEGLPLALVEAQCAGLPCYVSDCVPQEGDLCCGLVTFLSIGRSAEKWARNIGKSTRDRESASGKVAAAGYDIKSTAKKLEALYNMLHTTQRVQ